MAPGEASGWVTRSRRADLALFTCILVLMLLLSPRLRVYYDVTVVDVELTQLHEDGTRERLPTPARFVQYRSGYADPAKLPADVERAIDRHMAHAPPEELGGPGARVRWTVRYSYNSTALDRQHTVVREVGGVPD